MLRTLKFSIMINLIKFSFEKKANREQFLLSSYTSHIFELAKKKLMRLRFQNRLSRRFLVSLLLLLLLLLLLSLSFPSLEKILLIEKSGILFQVSVCINIEKVRKIRSRSMICRYVSSNNKYLAVMKLEQ